MINLDSNELAATEADETPPALRMPTATFQGRLFLQSLSLARRAEIARRARFRNQPYLRRSDEPSDDFLP